MFSFERYGKYPTYHLTLTIIEHLPSFLTRGIVERLQSIQFSRPHIAITVTMPQQAGKFMCYYELMGCAL